MDNGGDDDVIAYIYPAVGSQGYEHAKDTIDENKENPGYRPPRYCHPKVPEYASAAVHSGPPDIFNRRDREPTEDAEDAEERDPFEYEACIRVTFAHIPKTRSGLRCGRSEDAELRLKPLKSVSLYHFALTFNQDYCLVVQDLGSTCGTTVVYNGEERGRWSSFSWIVGGSDFLNDKSPIIVKVSPSLQFRLVVPQHDVQSRSYRDKVDRFLAGTADADPLLDLGQIGILSRRRTEVPSGVQTPVLKPTAPITLEKELGRGSFAVVYRVWDVNTGKQYALKRPVSRSFDTAAWEREALILRRIDHRHIVSLLNYSLGPTPCLHLEYVPGESVGDHLQAGPRFSHHECKQILAQTLDALAYLHMLDPQIVHRDIKPNNILVMYRRPDAIFVKFADFGLSREGDVLKTICGTSLYLAPEVYEASAILREERDYTALVDVWSLGVVLAELVCGLPRHGGGRQATMGVEWCNRVCLRVKEMIGLRVQGHDLLSFLLDSMLRLRPEARKTATDCLNDALPLLNHTTCTSTDEERHESNGVVSDGYSPDSSEHEASTIRLGCEARKADGSEPHVQATEPETGDTDPRSRLERYIISNPGRHHVPSTNAPSPKATTVVYTIEQLRSKHRLDNPEDRSGFGHGSDGGCSDSGESSSASTVAYTTARDTKPPQDGEVQGPPGSVLGLQSGIAALPEICLEARGTPPSTDAVKWKDCMGDIAEVAEKTDTCRGSYEADAAPSFKRPRTARYA
ncbi:checkpoint kinase [Sordaria brevicollis]|uniref:Checkpoint kinase n=1 Tax=Sordaria brevicollis TaxID=83679 RepID=A0AAE0NV59_SORBR|nr:checkpoint kinase [Sordaria brevicollis]